MKTTGNGRCIYDVITKMALATITQHYTSKVQGSNLKQNVNFGEVRVPLAEPFCGAGRQLGADSAQEKPPTNDATRSTAAQEMRYNRSSGPIPIACAGNMNGT
jgi:hypothetical protein